MENRRVIKLAIIVGGALIGALLITTLPVFAYDQENTHPALTDEIVDLYNLNFPDKKLTNQEKQWLIQGAKEEDTGERPIFHFYDPVYNRGIAHFSSKDWALRPSVQANYYNSQLTGFAAISGGDSANDFSYSRALGDYAKGDRERAFVAFGHTLHLLEDAGVPDHTRNDAHPSFIHGQESPYEHEMAKWNPNNFQIARKLFLTREKPVALNNMTDYFDKIANYSNNNFFSKDTINNKTYSNPDTKQVEVLVVNGKLRLFIINKDKNGQSFPIALVSAEKEKELDNTFLLTSPKIGTYILNGYWDRLSKEVVLNGAGALKLFIDEAEKAKVEYASKPPEKPNWFAKLLGLIGISQLTTSDGEATSDVKNEGVDNLNDGDIIVTPTPEVTKPFVSPTPLVTKTPDTNVTIVSPTPSPSKTPTPKSIPKPISTPTPKPSATPIPKLTTSDVKKFGTVVINEIAWAGTSASATDEWIELYNTENNPIDISSWQLVSNDDSPDIIFQEGTIIQANSYFLIERTDGNTVSDITTDLASGFGQGGLNNSGEMVRLFDSAGTVVDLVGSVGEAWYFGDSTSKNSMERIDPMKAGNNSSNWKSFSGTPTNKDASGGVINGTPKNKNSIATVVVVITSSGGGGGGGGSSSTPTPTPTPTPSVTPTPSPSPSPSPEPSGDTAESGDVVINEIAWMGTASSANDEWMELRNTTNQAINLTGWILKSEDDTPNITLSGSISPLGFFLLERTNDTTLPSISANQIYTGALGNTGENLVLNDVSGTIIDQINGSNEWKINGTAEIIGNNTTKQTAQKMTGGWVTAVSTPKAQNSENVVLNPSAVTNLLATINSPLNVTWSAPDPGSFSPASLSYDLRYSTINFPNTATWDTATKVASASLPNVGDEGASQSASFDVVHEYGQTVYFALKTGQSDVSNIATVSYQTAIDANAWSMFGKNQYHTSFVANVTGPSPTAAVNWEYDAGTGNNVSQPVVSADGDVYFGSANGSGRLIKLNKDGAKQWEYASNVSIGTPAVLSDEVIYFGRIGAGGALAFTALNSDGSKKWDYDDASTVKAVAVSSKGEPHFTYQSGAQDKLTVLKTDGSVKTLISGTGLSGFTPIVLENGNIITTRRISGNQFFTAYSSAGLELWDVAYTGANGSIQSNPSYDQATGKTYSAAGPKLLEINSVGSDIIPVNVAPGYFAATMVAILPDTLYVGFNDTNSASGSRLFAINKSDLTSKWSFLADSRINNQIAVDKDDNVYFSTESGVLYSVNKNGSQNWKIDAGTASTISPSLTENGIVWGYGSKIILVK